MKVLVGELMNALVGELVRSVSWSAGE